MGYAISNITLKEGPTATDKYYQLVAGYDMCIACGENFATSAEADACLIGHFLVKEMDDGDVASMLHDRFCKRDHASDDDLYPGDVDCQDLPITSATCFYSMCDREHAPQTGMSHEIWKSYESKTVREQEIWQVKARLLKEFANQHTIPLPELLALIEKLGFGGG